MKNFKKISIIFFIIVFSFLVNMNFVFADDLPSEKVEGVLIRAINWLAGILATVAVLMVLGGGVVWVTAGGEEERVKTARKWLTAGLIGLAVSLAAVIIVNVVLGLFRP
ncbi:MAG: hypothetical protein A3D38_01210 [Candidatus Portnoybacteria bacterium RIFCSPHIGHO2_02_FULL_40_23]|uniref:Uncharacterized protein n=1 Tax=Candidatus Portnoybacteria bacterium RIFCSPLOWO2_02_FULL_40_15 TaxID=1802002 RepID=A0A1G2FQM6_9BACT|nr:MAG: hypothetical protein A3D38_01210 [Candidatus Portnoybacteria bacterium RIFCSPHIGHO2_02_FULL_40_23]OGZ39930.1 MAG: hypothetical protein A3I20_03345 [Candidatus Portnoybacteria bacterium RIFCSPLOWO2_02_FULL_40_15]